MPEGPSSDEVTKALRRHGFDLVQQRGSHAKYRRISSHPGDPTRTVIVQWDDDTSRSAPSDPSAAKPDFNPKTSNDPRSRHTILADARL